MGRGGGERRYWAGLLEDIGMTRLEELSREKLIALVVELQEQVATLQERVVALEEELNALRSPPGGDEVARVAPDWVKPNRPKGASKRRRRRKQAFVRHRDEPTEVHLHAVETCPDCGRRLEGGWLHRRRQIIELPKTPIRIVEHQVMRRRCGVCGKQWVPQLDLSQEVVGQHRVGIGLMSLVAYLRTVARVPLRTIRSLLEALYGLRLGTGELAEISHAVAEGGGEEYAGLLASIRASPAVHADETGWREDGENGYLWTFSTPKVRYFTYNKSRAGDVAKEVLGEDFGGVVVSDFYSGYSVLLGRHQRCWVHLLRDLKKLKEEHTDDHRVVCWVEKVMAVYEAAKAFFSRREDVRLRARLGFEKKLRGLAKPYVGTDAAQRVLAERIERFLDELFVFVECPEVASENNAAERALRPAVIARKVSGGTRSERGSQTKSILMSLFGTWQLAATHPIDACSQMLRAPT